MKTIYRITIVLMISAILLVACAGGQDEAENSQPTEGAGLPNPASVNCEEKGGIVVMQKRGDGGEYGVCVFADNRQCEEWAMYRGECPEGGIDTTPFVTAASLYCAISGGEYAVTDKNGAEDEQGSCSLPGGKTCDVWEYYNGTCDADQ
jgi:hypothetical protein